MNATNTKSDKTTTFDAQTFKKITSRRKFGRADYGQAMEAAAGLSWRTNKGAYVYPTAAGYVVTTTAPALPAGSKLCLVYASKTGYSIRVCRINAE